MKMFRSKKAWVVGLALLLALFGPLLAAPRPAHADTNTELLACLRACIQNHPRFSLDRLACTLDCYESWGNQRVSFNIGIDSGSTGYTEYPEGDYLDVHGLSSATIYFDIFSGDPLQRIDLYVANDEYNPPPPDFGVLVGSDTDGANGWSITFDPALAGTEQWVGSVVAQASFTGHDPETDGDAAATHITNAAGPVGGIAELPDVAGSAGGLSVSAGGSSSPPYAAIAGAAAAAVVALAAGGWYARRRWMR